MTDLISREAVLKAIHEHMPLGHERSKLSTAIRSLPAPHHYASLAADRITELESQVTAYKRDATYWKTRYDRKCAESKP